MILYRFPENKITKALTGLLLFFLLYLSRDTLVTSSLLGFYKAQFLMLGLLAAAVLVFLWANRKDWKAILTDPRMAVMGICAVALLFPMVCKRDFTMMYFSVLVCVLAAVFFTYFLTLQEVAKYYVTILAVLGAYSVLAAYVLWRVSAWDFVSIPVFQNPSGVSFFNFIFSFTPLNYVSFRNFGIFREPGVYQYFLVLGLYLNHYYLEWEKEWQMWTVSAILAVTTLSTFATGGVIELLLFAVMVFFDKKLYRSKRVWIILSISFVGAGAVIAYCYARQNYLYYVIHWGIDDMLVAKFTYQFESVGDRVGSIFVNSRAFLQNPFLGQKLADVLYAIDNNTSSTMILFAGFGILGGILHVAGWIALVWKKEQKLWVNLILLLVLFMSFNTQNLIADFYFWLFPMMALTKYLAHRLKIPQRRK